MRTGIAQYEKLGLECKISQANPYHIIQMLMQGAIDRIATAKGFMQRKNYEEKGKYINKAIKIIQGLHYSLKLDDKNELASQIDAIYEYMVARLLRSSSQNAPEILDEVSQLMNNLKEGWDSMPQEIRENYAEETKSHINQPER